MYKRPIGSWWNGLTMLLSWFSPMGSSCGYLWFF